MNYKTNILRLDNLMLALGLSIAVFSGAAKAETNLPQVEQGTKVVAVPSNSSNSAQVTYTVVLPSSGSSMRLLFQPASTNSNLASATSSGNFVKMSLVAPQQ